MMSISAYGRDPIKPSTFASKFWNKQPAAPDEMTQRYIDIMCAVVVQAVDDMRRLFEKGKDCVRYDGGFIRADELYEFFHSDWFESILLLVLPDYSIEDVCNILEVEKLLTLEKVPEEETHEHRPSKYYSRH